MKHRLLTTAIAIALIGCGSDSKKIEVPLDDTVNLQIIAINDFHGHIATTSEDFGGTGRADYLSSNIQKAKDDADNTIIVSAGDLIGGSPFLSSYFHDEPTIEAMNLIGLDINAVGNHEFDEGPIELLRMKNGGSHPIDGDLDGDPFDGANFEFLAGNVIVNTTNETLFAPYSIRNFDGIDVAFIGLTLEGTPNYVIATGTEGLSFKDEAETVNELVPKLQEQGVESFVVLLHEGGFSDGGQNDCGTGLTGPIAAIVPKFDDAIDVVIVGHTDDEFTCEIDGKWVTMADAQGRLYTDIDVTLDKTTRDMTVVSINNTPNLQEGVTPDTNVTQLIEKYETVASGVQKTVVGTISEDINRAKASSIEAYLMSDHPIGRLVADAQLEATSGEETGSAVISFTGIGGLRSALTYESSGDELDGEVTYEEAYAVQPFDNKLVTMTFSGKQIHDLLEFQFEAGNVLQVSKGFTYEWNESAEIGNRVEPTSIMLNGQVIAPENQYRIVVPNFLSLGGDGFSPFREGTDRLTNEINDLNALIGYIKKHSPVATTPNRIIKLP